MDVSTLIPTLVEVEQVLALRGECALLGMILTAQEGVRQLQCENEELALQNATLRRSLESARRFAHLAHSYVSSTEAADRFREEFLSSEPGDEENPRVWRTTHIFTT